MSVFQELYQEVILDHNKNPRNYRRMDDANHHADGHNPLCGDKIKVYLNVDDGVVKDVSFEGVGCAISTASASLMTESIKGKPLSEVKSLFETFHGIVTTSADEEIDASSLGKLEALTGVREFPMRVKCATLAWHTMNTALESKETVATTE